jgi:hypothetical protein
VNVPDSMAAFVARGKGDYRAGGGRIAKMIGVIAPGRESECAKIMIGHGGSSCEIEARGRQTKTGKGAIRDQLRRLIHNRLNIVIYSETFRLNR